MGNNINVYDEFLGEDTVEKVSDVELVGTDTMTNNIVETEYEDVSDDTLVLNIENDDFINDDNFETFKLLNLKSKMNDIESLNNDLKNKTSQFLKSDESNTLDVIDTYIDEQIDTITEEDIKNMSDDDINNILTYDGKLIEFNIEFESDESINKFKKDYLIFRKQTLVATKKFDEELAKINEEIAASQAEFDEACNKFGNLNNLIKDTIKTKMDETDNEEKKKLYQDLLESFEYALTLDNVKEYLKSYKGKQVLSDFKFPKSSMTVYRKYKKILDSLKVTIELKTFGNFERVCLGEDYDKRPNIIMFSIIHFIASKYNKEYNRAFGLFITEFTVNVKNLLYNKFDNEDDKNIFINSLKDIIDIIG